MEKARETESEKHLRENEKKWTKPLMEAGWTVLPNVIFERQQALGLDAIDINILLHLASYWWKAGDLPHPGKKRIADAIGRDPRTIQRRIARMEAGGLIQRIERRVPGMGSKTNLYEFTGLITEATPYAQEKIEDRNAREVERDGKAKKKGKPKLRVVPKNDD
jgi:DNA-binding Lrp family transcriptional regulator